MAATPRITLIHATRVAIAPIEAAAQALWPEVETITILEEGLSVDRQKTNALSDDLRNRIASLAKYAEGTGSDGILFTCSAFGEAIETAAENSPVPILKPNEAMFDAAFAYGDRVAMIYTFPPAAAGLEDEFQAAAATRDSAATLASYFCEGALVAKRSGDTARHDRLVAETAAEIRDADVIMLAQFSMASALNAARKCTPIPILTSPEAAITEIRRRVESQRTEQHADQRHRR